MPRVVVAGSDADPNFAVVDFTNPASPIVTRVPSDPRFPFGACRVAMNGQLAVIGDSQGSAIRLVDVSNPTAPATLGFVNTKLAGISAIAIRDKLVVAGELFNNIKARVMLIDFSLPASPRILGISPTPFVTVHGTAVAISNVVFLSETLIAVAGASDPQIAIIDFSDPNNPQLSNFTQTQLIGSPAIDARNGKIAAGDGNGSRVNLFDANSRTLLRAFPSNLFPVNSVALSDNFIFAGSNQDPVASCIPLDGSAINIAQVGLGVGLITALDGTIGVCGANNNTFIKLVDVSAHPPAILGSANVQFGFVTSIAISSFDVSGGGGGGGTSGGGTQQGQGSQGGASGGITGGGHSGVVPPGFSGFGDHIDRPFCVRAIMVAFHLPPEKGFRHIQPEVGCIGDFIKKLFQGEIHASE